MSPETRYELAVDRKAREIDPDCFTSDHGDGIFSRRKVMRQVVAKLRARSIIEPPEGA